MNGRLISLRIPGQDLQTAGWWWDCGRWIPTLGLGWRIEPAVCFQQQESHFAQELSANVRVSGSFELRQGLVQISFQLDEFRLAGFDVHMERQS